MIFKYMTIINNIINYRLLNNKISKNDVNIINYINTHIINNYWIYY
jgi:hypothetical protein